MSCYQSHHHQCGWICLDQLSVQWENDHSSNEWKFQFNLKFSYWQHLCVLTCHGDGLFWIYYGRNLNKTWNWNLSISTYLDIISPYHSPSLKLKLTLLLLNQDSIHQTLSAPSSSVNNGRLLKHFKCSNFKANYKHLR